MLLVQAVLGTLASAQLNAALDQISPISYAALSGMSFTNSALQSATLHQRMTALQSGRADTVSYFPVYDHSAYPGTLVADPIGDISAVGPNPRDRNQHWQFFASALGTQGNVNSINGSSGSQPGYSFSSSGGLVGGDYRINEHLVLGLAGGYIDGAAYTNSNGGTLFGSTTVGSGGARTLSESLRYGAYATAFTDDLHGSFYLGGAQDYFDTSRNIAFPGFSNTATANPTGSELNIDSEAGYDFRIALAKVSPFIGFSYDRLSVGSFSEQGAGALDLNISPQTAESLRSRLGAQVSRAFLTGESMLTPYIRLGWQHEYRNQSRPIQAQFAGQGGNVFSVNTADVARDGALLGTGLNIDWSRNVSMQVAYALDERADFNASTFNGTLRWKF
jgi:uncharacterized protein with beta-barrel porin domain